MLRERAAVGCSEFKMIETGFLLGRTDCELAGRLDLARERTYSIFKFENVLEVASPQIDARCDFSGLIQVISGSQSRENSMRLRHPSRRNGLLAHGVPGLPSGCADRNQGQCTAASNLMAGAQCHRFNANTIMGLAVGAASPKIKPSLCLTGFRHKNSPRYRRNQKAV
jgi:hypothetical protein